MVMLVVVGPYAIYFFSNQGGCMEMGTGGLEAGASPESSAPSIAMASRCGSSVFWFVFWALPPG